MAYGSETWPMKKEDFDRLERAEHTIMRRMCGVTLRDRMSSKDLYSRLGMDSISWTVTRTDYGNVGMYNEMTKWTGLNVALNMK